MEAEELVGLTTGRDGHCRQSSGGRTGVPGGCPWLLPLESPSLSY